MISVNSGVKISYSFEPVGNDMAAHNAGCDEGCAHTIDIDLSAFDDELEEVVVLVLAEIVFVGGLVAVESGLGVVLVNVAIEVV